MSDIPYVPCAFPASIKGVAIRDGRVLLRNERDEWELPGGRFELEETPEGYLTRETEEETGRPVRVAEILDSWMYHIAHTDRHVFIVTHGCHVESHAPVVLSSEYKEAGLFTEAQVPDLPMPEGYKRLVLDRFARSRT